MIIDNEEVIKNILPSKLTNDIETNIKLIKRKLNIYNLKNQTSYSLGDFGLKITNNIIHDIKNIYYFYKELNKDFDYKLDFHQENYYKAFKFLKETLEGCELYEKKENPDSIYLFKKSKFILEQDFKDRIFCLSYDLIWAKIINEFGYKWLEVSNLCNHILEQVFKKGEFITLGYDSIFEEILEEEFIEGGFITTIKQVPIGDNLEEAFKEGLFNKYINNH